MLYKNDKQKKTCQRGRNHKRDAENESRPISVLVESLVVLIVFIGLSQTYRFRPVACSF